MSRTKKRIKKLLKKALPLAALAGGAMLLGRGRKPNMDIPDRNRGMMPTGIDKVISDVPVSTPTTIQDSMPRVGMKKGDIRPKNPLSKRVMDDGRVFTIEGAKKGIPPKVGNVKSIRPGVNTSFNPKSIIIKDGVRVPNPARMEADRLNMMRAIRSTPRTTFDAPDFSDMDPLMISAKNGGMIVKGEKKAVRVKKKKGIQVRGFGKARR